MQVLNSNLANRHHRRHRHHPVGGAAATAGEAQLGEAFLDDSVTGQIAALLFLEGDTGNVLQNGGASTPASSVMG